MTSIRNEKRPSSSHRRTAIGAALVFAALSVTAPFHPSEADAKGSSSLSVSTTASVSGSVVSGVITISNSSSKSETVSALRDSLEVRFPSGVTPPPLPAGSSSGWYSVASIALPVPVVVAAKGTSQIAYSLSTCGPGAPAYSGAKDMRSAATVTASQTASAQSLNFALPAKCPVCGNGKVEAGEQCDSGSCCTAACQLAVNGSGCNDGNACTRTDQCQAGICNGSNPVSCTASDQCHVAGACNPTTGACSNPTRANGSSCNDANACTQTDSCQSGICGGGNAVACAESDPCLSATCNPGTGTCSSQPKPDGTECMDGDACTVGDHCVGGACATGAPRDCNDHMSCTDDACEAATGCANMAATCDTCDTDECAACGEACDTKNAECSQGCWSSFLGCLNGCTSTYCAPFCQVDLGRCLSACPATDACRAQCDSGNGCAAGCIGS